MFKIKVELGRKALRFQPIHSILFWTVIVLAGASSFAMQTEKQDEREFTHRELSAEELREGWISLFDGSSLYGWRSEADVQWKLDGKKIVASAGSQFGLLRTTAQFDDFVLRVDFRASEQTDSGVFIRTSPKPKHPAFDCYEINIANEKHPFPTGSLVERKKTAFPVQVDQWHTCEITAVGDTIKVSVDGKAAATYQDEKPLGKGYIGLQFAKGRIEFGNIFIKPLNLESVFNGKDLSQWNQYPNPKTEFSVVEDAIHVKGGPGQLETRNQYADFTLQLECKTNAPRLNSGVFFRCIPGEKMNGYECQIQNGYKKQDRSQPEDCGTGGFFRRQNARKIVANDETWFHITLIADGSRFCAWVNGVQVSDWTDKRKPDRNPRRGLRLEPGTIMLQAHDPTTDIDFRNLRIRAIHSRR